MADVNIHDVLPYEYPIELLEDTRDEIAKDIEWYQQRSEQLPQSYRSEQIKTLKEKHKEYSEIIEILQSFHNRSAENYG